MKARRRRNKGTVVLALAAMVAIFPPASGRSPAAADSLDDRPQVLVHDNLVRTYELHVPPQAGPEVTLPLVIMLHGGYGDSQTARSLSGFDALADAEGFLVAYPNGVDRHWNDGRDRPLDPPQEADDVGFISALADELVVTHGADPDRTFVTGMSNGALMANRLGCERADRFLAIAPVAGSMTTGVADTCAPSRAISVMHFHGNADPLANYEGSDGQDPGPVRDLLAGGEAIGVEDAVDLWAENAACTSVAEKLLPDVDPSDGTRVREHEYRGCTPGANVVLYEIEEGGHTWPGGDGRATSNGPVSHDIDATATMWAFFKSRCPLGQTCPTELDLVTPPSVESTDPLELSATLTRAGEPVVGATVQFEVGGVAASATTGGDGVARVSPTADLDPGDYVVTAAYDGDRIRWPVSAASELQVVHDRTLLAYAGDNAARGELVDVAAVLADDDGNLLSGQMVSFTIDRTTAWATTDGAGRAATTVWAPDHGRSQEVYVQYGGATRYSPAATTATITWGNAGT